MKATLTLYLASHADVLRVSSHGLRDEPKERLRSK